MGDRATIEYAWQRKPSTAIAAPMISLFAWIGSMAGPVLGGTGDVDLRLASNSPAASVGDVVEIGLYAVSTTGQNVGISGLDVVLTWDPTRLELRGFANNPAYGWLLSGFLVDSGADGLNNAHDDGDALFQAVGQFSLPAMATPEGFLITTFKFNALGRTERTDVMPIPQAGQYSQTSVFLFGAINEDIVGALEPAAVAIAAERRLWPLEVSVRSGRTADVIIFGEYADGETFGVTIQAELMPSPGAQGTLTFTPAPPEDVHQAGDPWDGLGSFTAFDTNTAGAGMMLNGSVADNGTFLGAPLSYLGPLTAMPVQAGANALGVWQVSLATSAGSSAWEGAYGTTLAAGVVRVVEPFDGDGSGGVDVGDFAEFQACFTGPAGPVDPPAYDGDPRRRCAVYDDDEDGDIDGADFVGFAAVHLGPVIP